MTTSVVLRAVGTIAWAFVGWQVGSLIGAGTAQPRNAILGTLIGAVIGPILGPLIITTPYRRLRRVVGSMPLMDLLYAFVGLVLGLIVAALLSFPLSLLPWYLGHVLPVMAAAVCGYLGVSLMMLRRRELTHLVQGRFHEPSADGSAADGARVLLDTSAIIDGRIADISQTGFISGRLLVPRFVLRELQAIADSSDPLRRNRGRRGLDILKELQQVSTAPIEIVDLDARDVSDVDGKLVTLARQMSAPVITNDFNLNRVAELQGVRVLNVNQLANALKPAVLPGEEMAVHIIQEGRELNQGVAYLDDGTMIVVENGRRYLHDDIEVTVTRVLQTVAGRMIFAQPKADGRS